MIDTLRVLSKVNLSNFNYLERFKINNFEFTVLLDISGNISASCLIKEVHISLTTDYIVITNLTDTHIKIPFEDFRQDDSYLILKYGRILLDNTKN